MKFVVHALAFFTRPPMRALPVESIAAAALRLSMRPSTRSGEEIEEINLKIFQDHKILHVNVTGYPTAAWTAQQIRNAFPWDTAPRFLLRDRDGTYGHNFLACLEAMEVDEVLTAPQSPWQNPYVDRLIGSMRRECVDHVIVLNERSRPASPAAASCHRPTGSMHSP